MPTPVEHNGYVYTIAEHIGGGLIHLVANGQESTLRIVLHARLANAVGGSVCSVTCSTAQRTGKCWHGLPHWQDQVARRKASARHHVLSDGLLLCNAKMETWPSSARRLTISRKGPIHPARTTETPWWREKAWAYPVVARPPLTSAILASWLLRVKAASAR